MDKYQKSTIKEITNTLKFYGLTNEKGVEILEAVKLALIKKIKENKS